MSSRKSKYTRESKWGPDEPRNPPGFREDSYSETYDDQQEADHDMEDTSHREVISEIRRSESHCAWYRSIPHACMVILP